mgnify:CR=1
MKTDKIILSTILTLSLVLANICLIGILMIGLNSIMIIVFMLQFICFFSVSIGSYKELKKEIYRGSTK